MDSILTVYTSKQREALEEFFHSAQNAAKSESHSKKKLSDLSAVTGLSIDKIEKWLEYRKVLGSYKGRTIHTVSQVRVLEWVFVNYTQYPSTQLKRKLAEYIDMSYFSLQKWFQTRRQRGPPALLANHCHDEKEWEKTVRKIREMIKEAAVEEYNDIEGIPNKKRKIETETKLQTPPTPPMNSSNLSSSSSASSPNSLNRTSSLSPSPASSSPEFSPFTKSSTPHGRIISSSKLKEDISPPSTVTTLSHPLHVRNDIRLPSLREVLQQASLFQNPVVPPPQSLPHYPFASSSHPLPPSKTPLSRFLTSDDERTFILPPLPPMPQNYPQNSSFPPPRPFPFSQFH